MALKEFQRTVCRLIAQQRIDSGESYVAGSSALNLATGLGRISRDIDLFHDSVDAVTSSWQADRKCLVESGCDIEVLHERNGFVEAVVSRAGEQVALQWTADSAFRFFPLEQHEDFGLTLHPFDLATNKVLALVGRVEPRDWVDTIACNESIQHLGFLAWAASGKDPGFSPPAILEQAARSVRYSEEEIAALEFEGVPPDAAELSQRWRHILNEAREIVTLLPPEEVGKCVLAGDGTLFQANTPFQGLSEKPCFHKGTLRGAFPNISPP
jgi:hypothetical protein